MAEIEFLLLDQTEGMVSSGTKRKHRGQGRLVRLEEKQWHGFEICLHRMPGTWLQHPEHIREYVEKRREKGITLWTDSKLDGILKEEVQPEASPELAAFILKSQPFRQILILSRGQIPWEYSQFWQERFLENCYQDRNGLYLLGGRDADFVFLEKIYEDSGLAAVVTEQIPEVDGKHCVFVELDKDNRTDYKRLPQGCLYLDMTSNKEKQRWLRLKRTDISYMSVRNFLDTALKARYNAI